MSNIKFVKFVDKTASIFIKCGGVAVISCVVLIVFMIFKVALPLFFSPTIILKNQIIFNEPDKVVELGLGEYNDSFYIITERGVVKIYSIETPNQAIKTLSLRETELKVLSVNHISKDIYAIHWPDGLTQFLRIYSKSILQNGVRQNKLTTKMIVSVQVPFLVTPSEVVSSLDIENGSITRVYTDDKTINANIFKFEPDEEDAVIKDSGAVYSVLADLNTKIFLSLNENTEQLWVAFKSGKIARYKIEEVLGFVLNEELDLKKEISSIGCVFGGYSLLVAHADGELNSWIVVRLQNNSIKKAIVNSHQLQKMTSPIQKLQGSFQDKTYLGITEKGDLLQGQLTTEKKVFSLHNEKIEKFGLSCKANGLVIKTSNEILIYDIENPYHEISFSVLFGKVWYENYTKPEYVWQSGGGGDDSEGKLSLVPLIFGTLKGTFYAMLLSIPLALGSAIYISQFASQSLRSIIKPAVEMMSAIPSVVVGFIAALWLAPKVDDNFFLVFLSLPLFMFIFFLNLLFWNKFASNKIKKKAERGFQLIYLLPVLAITFILLYYIGPIVEESLFHGEFKDKFLNFFKIVGYDQRNCLIIGFALGFTVIPIIFSIAEDVLSTVPRSLMANSLALGANRWQSVWRVMLPSASPGIVAGVIIGFGRAIGETMIVVMATGNTPIMKMSIFNGMRTLSANIAVEIGEASFEGSLYRTLFLSAVILFIMTFILNTGAELIRQSLRKKYSQF